MKWERREGTSTQADFVAEGLRKPTTFAEYLSGLNPIFYTIEFGTVEITTVDGHVTDYKVPCTIVKREDAAIEVLLKAKLMSLLNG